MTVRDRPIEVVPTGEARKKLPQTSRDFLEKGVDADPVFFGAYRKPAGVMLSFERYMQLLDHVDDLAVALEVRRRDAADTGDRVTLDAVLAEAGLDRAVLEAQIAAEDAPVEDSADA